MVVDRLIREYRIWQMVNQTANELNALSDRELDDLGIGRWQIRELAHQSVAKSGAAQLAEKPVVKNWLDAVTNVFASKSHA